MVPIHCIQDHSYVPGNDADSNTPLQKYRRHRLINHLISDINPKHGDLILLFCYVITGLLDSSAVFVWGSFVSMQTGNTVYLGLGLMGADKSTRWLRALISIASFCVGLFCFAFFHRRFSPRRRWVLCLLFTIQILCVATAATIVTIYQISRNSPLTWKVIVLLMLVAFQSSGQAVMSRALQFNGLTSVVLTSVYCDLFSSPELPPLSMLYGVENRRRGGAVVCLLLGTMLGGLWAKSPVGLMEMFWTAVLCKACIAVAWLVWRGQPTENMEDDGLDQ
ncbi:hypothetical protein BDV27DRAFT_151511 [Aspergillus caelatus]|uniref:DUF1275 domain protein n=1 Tax=Aspergillus caelatus TaxID=61420 RepID=A0A5N6ZII6_9EURO|nr:uncharacterized protein BDV27DRAFT_151511 [Aspergillus caelatus]KAE8357198.1 hypothetical protein BDV27DRAFT_151511 [Aspergillus caelatus]